MKLSSSIGDVKGVGKKYLDVLNKYGIFTVYDFLLHFPVYYIDFNNVSTDLELGARRLYHIEIVNWNLSRPYRRRFSVLKVKAKIIANDQLVSVVFFNQHYLADFFKDNQTAYIFGQVEEKKGAMQINTPVLYSTEEKEKQSIIPVYTRINTIKSGKLKGLLANIFAELEDDYEDLPGTCLQKYGFPDMVHALKEIHFPQQNSPQYIDPLKNRFVYSECFYFQLELQYIRNQFKQVPRIHCYRMNDELDKKIAAALPFKLTADQETAVNAIRNDLQKDFAMQRLIQGDVGSGKTIVAFIALLIAVSNGYQGAFLAPTEILASQHFQSARQFFKSLNIQLLTGSTTAKKRKEILKQLLTGEIDILFGTHALFTETVTFKNLSMVIIDEQHRFGVSQRAALYYKGSAVDLLVTTATPIPRTMLLSMYNDLTVSTIKTKPRGRLPIITKIRRNEQRDEFYTKLKEQTLKGEKAFIILPLIEKSDFFTELRDIESEVPYFRKIFKGVPIGIVTGRTPADEKDEMLAKMVSGDIQVLIATTVIEVGIDVRDATVIVIENADRYGLSQLHQLRGRVGRGNLQSYCYLFPSPSLTESGKKRLKTITGTNDGFEIAETDLKMRGGGIISGWRQSGYLDFKITNLQDHMPIFKDARQDVSMILKDPSQWNDHMKVSIERTHEKLQHINFS
jgi:ATP-dependent DNA helicase RecG